MGKFCEENNLDKDACQKWFQHTLFGKVTHMKSSQGEPVLTERQRWTRDNFDFLRDHIVCHLTAKSEIRAPKGSVSQASAAAGSSSRRETVHIRHLAAGYTYAYVPIVCGHCDVKFSRFRCPSSSCQIAEGDNRVKRHCGEKV